MHASTSSKSNHRARWAAIGAAVAVSLGAGGLGIVKATSPEGASAYVPISPCRLLDTRADSAVGSPTGALGPDTEITLEAWGTFGNCTLPTATTGLQLNVTAVDASTLTNLRVYPEGADTPTASNLNPAPGEPPTPNAVTATLNTTNGQFHVFNRFGTVHIVIDVVGYFTDHMHDGDDIIDETLTGADVDDGTLTRVDIADEARVVSVADERDCDGIGCIFPAAFGDGTDLLSANLFAPSNGFVTVQATIMASTGSDSATTDSYACKLVNTTTGDESFEYLQSDTDSYTLKTDVVSLHHTFTVDSGSNNFRVHCRTVGGLAGWYRADMTGTYVSTTGALIFLPPITLPIGPIGP